MNKIVIKIGGSLLFTKNLEVDTSKVKEFCNIVQNEEIYDTSVIVCGGGIIARNYIKAFRKFRDNESLCDIIGIEVSRINARILQGVFGDHAYPVIPKNMEELAKALITQKLIIMGGLQPGQSTTSVALEAAEYSRANHVVILTDVDGIYDKDPKIHRDAKLVKKITPKKLQTIILNEFEANQALAGEYRIFDLVSLQILKRSNIKVTLMSGKNLQEFKRYINGSKDIFGTEISS
jgi:uridylate kinase